MAYAADTLRSLLKANVHNDATIADPGDLNIFLTLGQQKIIRDAPHVLGVKEGSISVVASTREYSLAADFFQMKGIFYATNGYHLTPIPMDEFLETVERLPTIPSGAPQGYSIFSYAEGSSIDKWRIRFDYNPDASYTYKYWYYWMPADISGTAVVPMSQIGFGELLVWAATLIARERNDPEGAMVALQHYKAGRRQLFDFNPQGPDYTPTARPYMGRKAGSTLQLPTTYPIE